MDILLPTTIIAVVRVHTKALCAEYSVPFPQIRTDCRMRYVDRSRRGQSESKRRDYHFSVEMDESCLQRTENGEM